MMNAPAILPTTGGIIIANKFSLVVSFLTLIHPIYLVFEVESSAGSCVFEASFASNGSLSDS